MTRFSCLTSLITPRVWRKFLRLKRTKYPIVDAHYKTYEKNFFHLADFLLYYRLA